MWSGVNKSPLCWEFSRGVLCQYRSLQFIYLFYLFFFSSVTLYMEKFCVSPRPMELTVWHDVLAAVPLWAPSEDLVELWASSRSATLCCPDWKTAHSFGGQHRYILWVTPWIPRIQYSDLSQSPMMVITPDCPTHYKTASWCLKSEEQCRPLRTFWYFKGETRPKLISPCIRHWDTTL